MHTDLFFHTLSWLVNTAFSVLLRHWGVTDLNVLIYKVQFMGMNLLSFVNITHEMLALHPPYPLPIHLTGSQHRELSLSQVAPQQQMLPVRSHRNHHPLAWAFQLLHANSLASPLNIYTT